MKDLGRAAFETLKDDNARTLTLDILIKTLGNKDYDFLNSKIGVKCIEMTQYDKIISDAQEAEEVAKEKQKESRKRKDEDSDDDKKTKSKKGKKKG